MTHYDSSFPLFVFGSLLDRDVLRIVSGMTVDQLQLREAYAQGYRQQEVFDESYPVLIADEASMTRGLVIEGLTELAMQRIHFFEGDEYTLARIEISTNNETFMTAIYFRDTGVYPVLDSSWDFLKWQADHKPAFVKRCESYMQLFGKMNATEADRYW